MDDHQSNSYSEWGSLSARSGLLKNDNMLCHHPGPHKPYLSNINSRVQAGTNIHYDICAEILGMENSLRAKEHLDLHRCVLITLRL